MNINDRVNKIRVILCENDNNKFAEKLGKSKQYASSICKGTAPVGKKMTDEILDAFPEVNRTWLILGEGAMLNTPNSEQMNVDAAPHSTVNTISHTGNGSTNNINAGSLNDMLMQMYEARLLDKDDVITTLKETIKALQGEVEQLRAYVKLTSTKYIEEIERMRQTTIDTHDIVKDCANHIGYSKSKIDY